MVTAGVIGLLLCPAMDARLNCAVVDARGLAVLDYACGAPHGGHCNQASQELPVVLVDNMTFTNTATVQAAAHPMGHPQTPATANHLVSEVSFAPPATEVGLTPPALPRSVSLSVPSPLCMQPSAALHRDHPPPSRA